MATLERIPWTAKNTIFAQLGKFAQIANLSESQRRKYDKDLKIYRDNINIMEYAKERSHEEGWKEGHEEGRAEGEKIGIEKGEKSKAIEIARNFKKAGIDINIIAENTGLTIDEINAL